MAGSFQRYGQLTPVVVCLREEMHEVLDGFKRLAAARAIGLKTLSTRLLKADERVAKAAIHRLNQTGRRPQEWEEAWIVHALVREDSMTQLEVAELLGRHKSWVCRRLALVENMKVVVTGYEDDVPVYNSRFLAFATHYGFRLVACRPRRPQTKGKVERPFSYVETSLFNGRTFSSLDHLNETTAWWLAQVADIRELREAKQTPLQLHAKEQPHLIPLPAQPYDVSPVVYRTVNVEGLVSYCQNGYSVPWRYIGSVLPVRITEKELIVYGPHVEEIARHALLPAKVTGQRVVLKEHRPVEDARRRQAQLEERFAELG